MLKYPTPLIIWWKRSQINTSNMRVDAKIQMDKDRDRDRHARILAHSCKHANTKAQS
jgi:hypothetical protein